MEKCLAVRDEVGIRFVGPIGRAVLCEVEFGGLRLHIGRAFAHRLETVCHAVVVNPEPYGPVAAEADQQFVAAVVQFPELGGDLRFAADIYRMCRDAPHRRLCAELLRPGQFQPDAACAEQLFTFARNTPCELGCSRNCYDDFPVGRTYPVFFGAERRRGGQQQDGKKKVSFHSR